MAPTGIAAMATSDAVFVSFFALNIFSPWIVCPTSLRTSIGFTVAINGVLCDRIHVRVLTLTAAPLGDQ